MKTRLPSITHLALVVLALAGGVAEFASLQRWRVKAWLTAR
jgi:hypothetical protein